MKYLKAFNIQILSLLNELLRQYPKDGDLILYNETIETVIKLKPDTCLLNFVAYVYPNKDKIMKMDETYFMNYDVKKDFGNDSEIIKLSNKIKDIWNNDCSDDNKLVIWKYFKVLIKLCEKCVAESGAI